ncbi:MAG: polysaccharide deacetylase family protein [Natrialbaceae archaeon]
MSRAPTPADVPADVERVRSPLPGDAPFALCLTHDVDRPYKGIRSLYYAARERSTYHLETALSRSNPYWQFESIAALEADLGVRSAFYFLNEQHLLADRPVRDWFSPTNWVQHLGRYDVTAPDVAGAIRRLADGGWEVGLHGSYHSPDDRERLAAEKATLEDVLGEPIAGGRQHYLRLSVPETWRHHRAIGLRYDASLGSSTECGFQYGYRPLRPFGDDFLVFPLTVMEQALPDPGTDPRAARDVCEELLQEAAANDAVMTALWHPRLFNEREFPGYRGCYRWLIERAQDLGAWIGPPRALVEALVGDRGSRVENSVREAEPGTVDGS